VTGRKRQKRKAGREGDEESDDSPGSGGEKVGQKDEKKNSLFGTRSSKKAGRCAEKPSPERKKRTD